VEHERRGRRRDLVPGAGSRVATGGGGAAEVGTRRGSGVGELDDRYQDVATPCGAQHVPPAGRVLRGEGVARAEDPDQPGGGPGRSSASPPAAGSTRPAPPAARTAPAPARPRPHRSATRRRRRRTSAGAASPNSEGRLCCIRRSGLVPGPPGRRRWLAPRAWRGLQPASLRRLRRQAPLNGRVGRRIADLVDRVEHCVRGPSSAAAAPSRQAAHTAWPLARARSAGWPKCRSSPRLCRYAAAARSSPWRRCRIPSRDRVGPEWEVLAADRRVALPCRDPRFEGVGRSRVPPVAGSSTTPRHRPAAWPPSWMDSSSSAKTSGTLHERHLTVGSIHNI
jgi:hypothetical protein